MRNLAIIDCCTRRDAGCRVAAECQRWTSCHSSPVRGRSQERIIRWRTRDLSMPTEAKRDERYEDGPRADRTAYFLSSRGKRIGVERANAFTAFPTDDEEAGCRCTSCAHLRPTISWTPAPTPRRPELLGQASIEDKSLHANDVERLRQVLAEVHREVRLGACPVCIHTRRATRAVPSSVAS